MRTALVTGIAALAVLANAVARGAPSESPTGTPQSGVYLASGGGSRLKLTVSGRSVEITTGTSFRVVCAGPVTKSFTGHSPDIRAHDFHPGFHAFPLDASGHFSIKVLSAVLEGRLTGPSTFSGTYTDGASTECVSRHSWTATPAGGAVSPLVIPVLPRTYGFYLVQKSLLPAGWVTEPVIPIGAKDVATGHSASWNVAKGEWYDLATGAVLSKPVAPKGGWRPGSALYTTMMREALPRGEHAGGGVTWDDQLQAWRRGAKILSRSGLGVLAGDLRTNADRLDFKADGSGANATGTAWNVCIYLDGTARHTGTVTLDAVVKPFVLDAKGRAEVVFTVHDDGVQTFVIRHTLSNGRTATEGSGIAPIPTLAAPPWGLPACTPP